MVCWAEWIVCLVLGHFLLYGGQEKHVSIVCQSILLKHLSDHAFIFLDRVGLRRDKSSLDLVACDQRKMGLGIWLKSFFFSLGVGLGTMSWGDKDHCTFLLVGKITMIFD